jgi:hypothetical protein
MRGQQARGQDGRLVNVVRVSHLGPVRTANGFERADPLLVASVVQELVREDAAALLASIFPTPNTGEPEDRLAPVVERTLLPPLAQFALVIPANLQRLVVFKDAAAAAARYTARSGFIHWAMQVEDHVGDVIG